MIAAAAGRAHPAALAPGGPGPAGLGVRGRRCRLHRRRLGHPTDTPSRWTSWSPRTSAVRPRRVRRAACDAPEQYGVRLADADDVQPPARDGVRAGLVRQPAASTWSSSARGRHRSGGHRAVTLLMLLAGTTFAGHDWNTGSMSNQLLFEPRRARVWVAKAARGRPAGGCLASAVAGRLLDRPGRRRVGPRPRSPTTPSSRRTSRPSWARCSSPAAGVRRLRAHDAAPQHRRHARACSSRSAFLGVVIVGALGIEAARAVMPWGNFVAFVVGGYTYYDYELLRLSERRRATAATDHRPAARRSSTSLVILVAVGVPSLADVPRAATCPERCVELRGVVLRHRRVVVALEVAQRRVGAGLDVDQPVQVVVPARADAARPARRSTPGWLNVSVVTPSAWVRSSSSSQTSSPTCEVRCSRCGGSQTRISSSRRRGPRPRRASGTARCPTPGRRSSVPIQRASRSGSVTAAQTSSIGARNSRVWTSTCCPSRCSIRPVGWCSCGLLVRGRCGAPPLAAGPADLGLQGVQGLVADRAGRPARRRTTPPAASAAGRARSSARGPASATVTSARLEQQPQVLADRRPADRAARGQVDDPARLGGQLGQQRAPHRVGQRPEDVHANR